MIQTARRLRTPEERVGQLPNASLPPPASDAGARADDDLLLRALRDRDERAFARVLDRYFQPMLRLALTHVRDRAAAEEVVQETWLAALDAIARFEGRSSVRTWLFRILRNIARARGRRDARLAPVSTLATTSDATSGDLLDAAVHGAAAADGRGRAALWSRGTDPEQQLLARELAGRIDAAIATLPARQREVLVLRDVEGWDAADVCNALGLSDTNQRVLLHRARERVRTALRGYLEHGCGDDDGDLH